MFFLFIHFFQLLSTPPRNKAAVEILQKKAHVTLLDCLVTLGSTSVSCAHEIVEDVP
jgi:hypothetical protein